MSGVKSYTKNLFNKSRSEKVLMSAEHHGVGMASTKHALADSSLVVVDNQSSLRHELPFFKLRESPAEPPSIT